MKFKVSIKRTDTYTAEVEAEANDPRHAVELIQEQFDRDGWGAVCDGDGDYVDSDSEAIEAIPDIPKDHPVQPIKPWHVKTWYHTRCGTCGLYWDDSISTSMTPAPSGRCPFECYH